MEEWHYASECLIIMWEMFVFRQIKILAINVDHIRYHAWEINVSKLRQNALHI